MDNDDEIITNDDDDNDTTIYSNQNNTIVEIPVSETPGNYRRKPNNYITSKFWPTLTKYCKTFWKQTKIRCYLYICVLNVL